MASRPPPPAEDLSSVAFADLIHSVATGIADAQFQMDKSSIHTAEFMGGHPLLRDPDTGQFLTRAGEVTQTPESGDTRVYFGYTYDANGKRQANLVSMMELGFVPTFYQFVDTVIELKIAVRLQKTTVSDVTTPGTAPGRQSIAGAAKKGTKGSTRTTVAATPVDARYKSMYNYSADMASKVSTKVVPVPPPPLLQDRIRALIAQEAPPPDNQGNRGTAPQSAPVSVSTAPQYAPPTNPGNGVLPGPHDAP